MTNNTLVDTLIEYALRDADSLPEKEQLGYYRNARPILRDEILTLYQWIREKGLEEEYLCYRGR